MPAFAFVHVTSNVTAPHLAGLRAICMLLTASCRREAGPSLNCNMKLNDSSTSSELCAADALSTRMAPVAGAAVAKLHGFQPGAFGGFGSAAADGAFQAEAQAVLDTDAAEWCCG